MQMHLRTLLILLAVGPLGLRWLWEVRAEVLLLLPFALPIGGFLIALGLYVATLVVEADSQGSC